MAFTGDDSRQYKQFSVSTCMKRYIGPPMRTWFLAVSGIPSVDKTEMEARMVYPVVIPPDIFDAPAEGDFGVPTVSR